MPGRPAAICCFGFVRQYACGSGTSGNFAPHFQQGKRLVKSSMKTAVLALGLTCASLAVADSELSSAVASFPEDNKRLEAALGQELTAERLKEIYEISYRLQGSLSTINMRMDELADTLEELHIESESANAEAVSEYGASYLGVARSVIR